MSLRLLPKRIISKPASILQIIEYYNFGYVKLPLSAMNSISKCLEPMQKSCDQFMQKYFSTSMNDEVTEQYDPDLDDILNGEQYKSYIRDICSIPYAGHQLFVIQPDIKWGPRKPLWSTAALRLQESCTLVETLPRWHVVDKKIVSVKRPGTAYVFGKGNFEDLTSLIRSNRYISGVLMGIDMLTSRQLDTLQKHWGVPVFDRYAIVLQIFKDHARTKESKLQIALAEIPFLRNRLSQIETSEHDHQIGGSQHVGGSGESYMEHRRNILQEREEKIRKAMSKLKNQRILLRKNRLRKEIPSVAVVGYTNAGKTTLIKTLTGDSSLEPKDVLFATLDVTAHAGRLSNNMTVLFMDTVGFISNIPTNLIDAFSATLEDALIADVIVHVRDISHPDTLAQKHNVQQTLSNILPEHKMKNIIEVCNKIDLCTREVSEEDDLVISAYTGQGLTELKDVIQTQIIVSTGQIEKKFKVPMGGPHLSWLYKAATVRSVTPYNDSQYLIVDTIISLSSYAKFKSEFAKSKQMKS